MAADLEWLPGSEIEADGDGPLEALPPWFVVMLVAGLAAIVAFGTIGLTLAVLGVMAPLPTLALGFVATAALVATLAPWRVTASRDRDAQVPALLAVTLVAGAVVFALKHHAQHVLLDRDPGGYVLTGRWLATHHTLAVDARVGAFKHAPKVAFATPGVFFQGRNDLFFQFSHLLPTFLAQARWIGGDRAMFFVPAVLGGAGLLAFYALATRFVRPWFALAALGALATNLVETHFMRDAYSELPTQAVLLGALWLLTRRGVMKPFLAGFTGLLLGATVMARIDGPLYLVVVPLVLGGAVLAHRRGDAHGTAALGPALWFIGGVACTTALGYLDVSLRSADYLHALQGRVNLQYAGLAFACAVAVAIALFAPDLATWPARAARGRLGDVAALVVGGGLFAAWFLRPMVQTTFGAKHGETLALQIFDHVRHDPSRQYSEQSMHWQAWYIGALTLAAGIVGVALLVRAIVRGRGGREGLVVTTFLAVAAVYLWSPSIFADQPWVMRRYLPVVIPGFVLCAFVIVELLWRRAHAAGARSMVLRGAALVLVIASIAWPLSTSWRVRGDTTQGGFLGSIHQVCALLGPHAAVVVLQGGFLEQVLPQTIRSFCDVPTAVSQLAELPHRPPGPMLMKHDDFAALAADWRREGRTLFVVADRPQTIHAVLPTANPVGTVTALNTLFLQERIVARPDGFRRESYTFVVAPVPAG